MLKIKLFTQGQMQEWGLRDYLYRYARQYGEEFQPEKIEVTDGVWSVFDSKKQERRILKGRRIKDRPIALMTNPGKLFIYNQEDGVTICLEVSNHLLHNEISDALKVLGVTYLFEGPRRRQERRKS